MTRLLKFLLSTLPDDLLEALDGMIFDVEVERGWWKLDSEPEGYSFQGHGLHPAHQLSEKPADCLDFVQGLGNCAQPVDDCNVLKVTVEDEVTLEDGDEEGASTDDEFWDYIDLEVEDDETLVSA